MATDNQSIEALQRQGTTTKFPLCVNDGSRSASPGLRRGPSLDLRQRRRDRNFEADALTNEDFSGFDLSKRVEVSGVLDGMICLPWLSAACSRFKEKLVSSKAQGPCTAGSGARWKEAEGLGKKSIRLPTTRALHDNLHRSREDEEMKVRVESGRSTPGVHPRCAFVCVRHVVMISTGQPLMIIGCDAESSARRRWERQLRLRWRHEQRSAKAAVPTTLHHTRDVGPETRDAPRSWTTAMTGGFLNILIRATSLVLLCCSWQHSWWMCFCSRAFAPKAQETPALQCSIFQSFVLATTRNILMELLELMERILLVIFLACAGTVFPE